VALGEIISFSGVDKSMLKHLSEWSHKPFPLLEVMRETSISSTISSSGSTPAIHHRISRIASFSHHGHEGSVKTEDVEPLKLFFKPFNHDLGELIHDKNIKITPSFVNANQLVDWGY
jgi:hypothetical protein